MAGKPGLSGRKTEASRALAFGPGVPVPHAAVGPVPASVVAGLGQAGADFVQATWSHYEQWAPEQETLLHEGGRVVDALHEYAVTLKVDGRIVEGPRGGTALHPLVRVEAQALRSLMLILKSLRLEA